MYLRTIILLASIIIFFIKLLSYPDKIQKVYDDKYDYFIIIAIILLTYFYYVEVGGLILFIYIILNFLDISKL